MTWVSDAIQTSPTTATVTPVSSHALEPASRSHCGAAKTPVSSVGSIST